MQTRNIAPHEILLPVRATFIIFTFITALLINLLPWSGWWLAMRRVNSLNSGTDK